MEGYTFINSVYPLSIIYLSILYTQGLKDDIKSETSGRFEDCLVALITNRPVYEADILHKAMKGAGTDEAMLIEILTTRCNEDMKKIKEAYKKGHK